MSQNLLLYVHFNKDNTLAPYVVYQLEHLRAVFSRVYFISNSPLPAEKLDFLKTKHLANDCIVRENTGYDFSAWSEAMKAIGFESLAAYNSVTLMNDTCFGPIVPFAPTFADYAGNDKADFWGITNNKARWTLIRPEKSRLSTRYIKLPTHIQSYYITFKQRLVQSAVFQDFWNAIEPFDNEAKVITRYETRFTQLFEAAGFHSAVLFDTRKEMGKVRDASIFSYQQLIERQIPFIKKKAFIIENADFHTQNGLALIKKQTTYPTELITDYFAHAEPADPRTPLTRLLNRLRRN